MGHRLLCVCGVSRGTRVAPPPPPPTRNGGSDVHSARQRAAHCTHTVRVSCTCSRCTHRTHEHAQIAAGPAHTAHWTQRSA
jgi:hypothetical protein